MIGVATCLGRSWASEQGRVSLNPDLISFAEWVNNPCFASFLVMFMGENEAR